MATHSPRAHCTTAERRTIAFRTHMSGFGPAGRRSIHAPKRESPQLNPASYALMGRSEGFAASAGSTTLGPEHYLLALLWDPDSVYSGMLRELGTSRADVYRALRRLNIPVPPLEPPPDDERPWGERVWVPRERFEVVLRELPLRLPERSRFGFNFTADGRACGCRPAKASSFRRSSTRFCPGASRVGRVLLRGYVCVGELSLRRVGRAARRTPHRLFVWRDCPS